MTIDRLLQIEGILPLTPQDEDLFRFLTSGYRHPDNCRFEDSWAYILQSTRHFPAKYYVGAALVILTTKKDQSAIVIPNHFPDVEIDLVDRIHKETGLPVILKNVDVHESQRLIDRGFRSYRPGECWDPRFRYDDQTHPQRIVRIDQLLSLKGLPYHGLRRDLNRFKRGSERPLISRPYTDSDRLSVIQLMGLQERRISGTYEAHHMYLELRSTSAVKPLVFEIAGAIVGFSLVDRISVSCAALNALIYDSSIQFLSARMVYEMAKEAAGINYTFLNLQGSETASLDQWKLKFNPEKSIEKTHLVYTT